MKNERFVDCRASNVFNNTRPLVLVAKMKCPFFNNFKQLPNGSVHFFLPANEPPLRITVNYFELHFFSRVANEINRYEQMSKCITNV